MPWTSSHCPALIRGLLVCAPVLLKSKFQILHYAGPLSGMSPTGLKASQTAKVPVLWVLEFG